MDCTILEMKNFIIRNPILFRFDGPLNIMQDLWERSDLLFVMPSPELFGINSPVPVTPCKEAASPNVKIVKQCSGVPVSSVCTISSLRLDFTPDPDCLCQLFQDSDGGLPTYARIRDADTLL